jgi:DNA-binding response OmpR family regulator
MLEKRVLVVEDEPTVAKLIGEVLEEAGMHVEVAISARKALERARSEVYDLVICDIKMPDLDGREMYRMLTEEGRATREQLLFVTGDIVTPSTREFLQANRLAFVAKPFRLEELMERIRQMLELESSGVSSRGEQPQKLAIKSAAKRSSAKRS